jgi:protein involved in polysaccharide export with SLBB domain
MRYSIRIAASIFTVFFILVFCAQSRAVTGIEGITPEEGVKMFRALPIEQQREIAGDIANMREDSGSGAAVSGEAKPSLPGLTPEEIDKGRRMLEGREEPGGAVKQGQASSSGKRASLFDRYRTGGKYQDISLELKPFGYDFFSEASLRELRPRQDTPVAPDYIVGPGDEIKVMIWGRVNDSYSLPVNRDGEIKIPKIGPLSVAGMKFAVVKKLVTEKMSQIVGANVSVTMGALKSIRIFVLGEVLRPGSYALDSFSTITNAIIAAGGPSGIGSLRHIELKRKNKTLVVMDFYDFLLRGDKSADRVLQSGDVVFVPTAGPLVGVAGNVKRPAIYELGEKKDLRTLIDLAGGLIPSAYTQQIQIERIRRNRSEIVMDISDGELSKAGSVGLQDGDLVKVFSIVEKDANALYLYGNVRHPGKYEYRRGMRIKDLIADDNELLKDTYMKYALIKRLEPGGGGTKLIPFDLGALLEGSGEKNNPELVPRDSIYVFSRWRFEDRPSVTVQGQVRRPGEVGIPENARVKDAIMAAGGLTKDADRKRGEIFRRAEDGTLKQIYFSVQEAMNDDPAQNLLLRDKDRIVVHSLWETRFRQTVSVDGEINKPGEYPLAEKMCVSDLIFAAGNLSESAFLDDAELSSYELVKGRLVRVSLKNINLRLAMSHDPSHDLTLKPYDRLFVRRIPDWRMSRFVTLKGEVRFPGKYMIRKGERLSSVIERAGGFKDSAYLRGAVFTRRSVRDVQAKGITEMLNRLEKELLSAGAVQASVAVSKEEVEAKKIEFEQKRRFIETLRGLKPSGRMTIRLSHLRLLKNSDNDVELEDGDTLFVPSRPDAVHVIGAVMSQGSFIFSGEMDYRAYIDAAGGLSPYADEKNIYIIKADGSARKVPSSLVNWNLVKSRWEVRGFGDNDPLLEPGDTIVVPEKLQRFAWMREVKDLTQILYQIAVTAGVLIVAF